jgi:hypothetical protein
MGQFWAPSAFRTIAGGVILIALASTCGCLEADALAFRGQAQAIRDDLARQEAQWQHRLAQSPPEDPDHTAIQARASLVSAQRLAADSALQHVDSTLAEANNPQDPLSRLVGVFLPWLPEPVRTPVALGSALAVTILRARRLKIGMASIARGLDRAMREDEQFAMRFRQHANTFRLAQTPLARRIVDEATTNRFMVRLPL